MAAEKSRKLFFLALCTSCRARPFFLMEARAMGASKKNVLYGKSKVANKSGLGFFFLAGRKWSYLLGTT